MSSLPTGTVTFLFTDIEGSTRLLEQHPGAMQDALARHDTLLRDIVQLHQGYLVKTTGDGLHAAFATAPQALQAVLTAQRALLAQPWQTPLALRMGLHTGDCEERGGDYYGPALNRAARLMTAGHGGQVLLSAATQELVRDHLPEGTGLLDLGKHRLKDLGRPEQVYQLLHPGLPANFPPLRSLDNPALPNNLPQQVTSFVGRETQVAEVKEWLGKTRPLTLTTSPINAARLLNAAHLWGVSEENREETSQPISPSNQKWLTLQISAVRAAFSDDAAFDAAWKFRRCLEGRACNDARRGGGTRAKGNP